MKRRPRKLLKLGLLLLLGAIINVASALSAFHFARTKYHSLVRWSNQSRPAADDLMLWNKYSFEGWPNPACTGHISGACFETKSVWMFTFGEVLYESTTPEAELRNTMAGHGDFEVQQIRAGFPLRCVSWEYWNAAPTYPGFTRGWGDNGWHLSRHVIPLTVQALGFAINTIFYAAIVWLLFFAPFQFRRWRRSRRGLCPACAYPVGTSDNCTECGKPVTPRRGAGM